MNYQEIYHTLISQTLMWIPICAASYYSVLYYVNANISDNTKREIFIKKAMSILWV